MGVVCHSVAPQGGGDTSLMVAPQLGSYLVPVFAFVVCTVVPQWKRNVEWQRSPLVPVAPVTVPQGVAGQ